MLKSTVFNLFFKRNAGHSKWANIKHIKGQKDAERNLLFTKLARQIRVAVDEGGSIDPKSNLKLSHVIEQCKRFNMPQATLNNVLKSCENDKTNAKLHLVEIKGPGTSILLCEIFTNNLHLIRQSISTILRKHQSKYSDSGAIYLFQEKGIIHAENSNLFTKPNDEQIEIATDDAIDSNAEEVTLVDENVFEFLCGKTNFMETQKILEQKGYTILNSAVEYIPHKNVNLAEFDYATYEKLLSKLEQVPEVTRVFDNVNKD